MPAVGARLRRGSLAAGRVRRAVRVSRGCAVAYCTRVPAAGATGSIESTPTAPARGAQAGSRGTDD
jgi:hypothetical protein